MEEALEHIAYFYKDEDTFLTSARPPPAVVTLAATACSTMSSTKNHVTLRFL